MFFGSIAVPGSSTDVVNIMGKQHILVLLCLTSLAGAQKSMITCHSSPAEINKTIDMTFTLPEDPTQTKRSFTVYHYNDHTFRKSVLHCPWHNDRHYCIVGKGYSFDWKITQNFTLSIQSFSEAQRGYYACQLADYDTQHMKPCRVDLLQVIVPAADADFMCSLKANTLLCRHEVYHTLDSSFTKNFTLIWPSLSDNTVTIYSCSRSTSYISREITTKAAQDISAVCSPFLVTEGQQAAVACSFGDIVMEHSFLIVHYNTNNTKALDFPLVCFWTRGRLECEVLEGYQYEIIIDNNTAILRLPYVTSEQLGTYTCKSVTSHVGHGSCTLTLPAVPESEETDTFLRRYQLLISGAVGAFISAAVTVTTYIFVMYIKDHRRYAHPRRSPASDNDPYRNLSPMTYRKSRGVEENNSLYEEVRDSPPSERTSRPVTVSSARSPPGKEIPHIVTSSADDKEITPPLSPRLRPEDSSIPEGEKNPTSPMPHPSGSHLNSFRHTSSSHQDEGVDQSKYYLHPVQEAVCTVSEEKVCQSQDISEKSLRDAKIHDERSDYDGRQVARQSDTYLQLVDVSGHIQDSF